MKKILLTSASRVFLKRNTNLLLRKELQLFTETKGEEALKLHQEHNFDLILSDLQLEDMGGCAFCSLVRKLENFQDVPVILSCHKISGSMERAERSGASAIVLKPIDPIQLMETIGRFIDMPMVRNKRVTLTVKVSSKKLDLEFFCLSHDISTTGILLETDILLALGNRITCQFTLPGSSQIEIEGEVIRSLNTWEYKTLYGVKFIVLSPAYRKAIDDHVSSTTHAVATPGYSPAAYLAPYTAIR